MKSKKIIIGSRGSKLALIYAEKAKNQILKFSKKFNISNVEIKTITTTGDLNLKVRLSELGGKGLFSKKIEEELLDCKIDLAIHALKDMPSIETNGLVTNSFLERNDPREVLISRDKIKFKDLKPNSIIGTSSFRREYQLRNIRNDLNFKLIRGNIDTRLKKVNDRLYDAVILASAGIDCLDFSHHISEIFSVDEIIPSAGQGVIALQCRKDDEQINEILQKINHANTYICVQAERNVLKFLEGDCETAIGVISHIDNENIKLKAELFSLDGSKRFYYEASKNIKEAQDLGLEVGENLKRQSLGNYKK
tara:strand:- start:1087 stop:2010 length:924 start_codon:yes stop_codon:yes gene_type:complete